LDENEIVLLQTFILPCEGNWEEYLEEHDLDLWDFLEDEMEFSRPKITNRFEKYVGKDIDNIPASIIQKVLHAEDLNELEEDFKEYLQSELDDHPEYLDLVPWYAVQMYWAERSSDKTTCSWYTTEEEAEKCAEDLIFFYEKESPVNQKGCVVVEYDIPKGIKPSDMPKFPARVGKNYPSTWEEDLNRKTDWEGNYHFKEESDQSGTTYSEAGSLRIVHEGLTILIPNGYGDGVMKWYETKNRPMQAHFFTTIEGDFDITTQDFGTVKKEAHLSGRYGVYYLNGNVFFEKWED
jgi:hypothetical protein